jgi:Flavodoxin-like fold
VLAYGEVYASRRRFENGRLVGKRAMLSVTVGTSRETYMYDGRSGDIDLILWPINFTLAYVGYEVLAPFVAYGVEGGLRYSDQSAIDARLQASRTISAANSPKSTNGKRSRSIERLSGEPTAGLSPTPRSIHPLSAAGKISNWSSPSRNGAVA